MFLLRDDRTRSFKYILHEDARLGFYSAKLVL
jgi:hypothetical protein